MAILNADRVTLLAKTDYAANGGDIYVNLGPSPKDYTESLQFEWPDRLKLPTGVIFSRSQLPLQRIEDGTSKTYLLGEKYLRSTNYTDGLDLGDDLSLYQGDDSDTTRWTMTQITDRWNGLHRQPNSPRRDAPEFSAAYAFGSAHPSGWNAAFCDGSNRTLAFDLDHRIHQSQGNRFDATRGGVLPGSQPASQ